jgi:hypothetical protein
MVKARSSSMWSQRLRAVCPVARRLCSSARAHRGDTLAVFQGVKGEGAPGHQGGDLTSHRIEAHAERVFSLSAEKPDIAGLRDLSRLC